MPRRRAKLIRSEPGGGAQSLVFLKFIVASDNANVSVGREPIPRGPVVP